MPDTSRVQRIHVDSAPILVHVPHASTAIPASERAGILLDDDVLDRELVRLTDWHVDRLFDWTALLGATRFVNAYSRLLIDPERFPDDAKEPMARVGQGAVYTRTTDGAPLRVLAPGERQRLMDAYYWPYTTALAGLVDTMLATHGRCLILDCHSFATVPLPSEREQSPDRPDICIGTDSAHTPAALASALEAAFASRGLRVARNAPFAGTYVPMRDGVGDPRVSSVMIEVRRGLYCDESTGAANAGFDAMRKMLEEAVGPVLREWLAG